MQVATIENNKIVILEEDSPSLGDIKGAIVKIVGCGLCGSDIVKFTQHPKNGLVLGHEIVGIIQEINSSTNFKVGDKIVMGHHVPCFECVYCANENYSMCKHFKETNIIPGGFAEYIFASEEHLKHTVLKISDTMDEVKASFVEPLACCVRAVRRANLKNNSKVLVVGLGSIGLLMGQALKAYGHMVIGCDLLDVRLDIAKNVGFDVTLKSNNIKQTEQKIKELTNSFGVDAVFMTSGAYQTIPLAIDSVRDGGKIVVFSSVPSLNGYTNNDIYYRELTVMGAYSSSPMDLKIALDLLLQDKVIVKNFSTLYNLSEIEKAIDDTIKNRILKAYIKI